MKPKELLAVYEKEGGGHREWPAIDVPVYHTDRGCTPYLRDPGVVVIAQTRTFPSNLSGFLHGFDEDLQFGGYLNDGIAWQVVDVVGKEGKTEFIPDASEEPKTLPDTAQLVKLAGQLCYMSFGPDRTRNLDTVKYIHNLVASGHGSVLEHPNVSILFYGVSRSLTHELVRHRAGFGYSQLSQRYVDGTRLRFVERPEYQADRELHEKFEEEIDRQAGLYEETAQILLARQERGGEILSGETKRDRRKKVNQAARSVLGNHAEAPIIATANLRAWRHMLSMRAAEHAEVEIRRAAYRAFLCLAMLDPIVFGDFKIMEYADGTKGVTTFYPKV
jgi:thymidylate synthase (FAD)